MASLKTRPFERNLALTRLGLGAGTQLVAHSLMNVFRGGIERSDANREFYAQQAEVLASELGKLKGSVMKAGQMLSLFGQYFLPEEAVAALAQLQDDTAPVQWKLMAPVLERQLGRQRLAELEIDTQAMAAASLGQAHRARRKSDGLEMVVKIQYPGVAEAIESDIRTLSKLLLMSRLVPKGLDAAPMFDELREMLLQEVDYVAERRFTEDFAARLAGDTRFAVPRVIGEYSSGRVLTTSYEPGVNVQHESVRNLSQARRNRLGLAFVDLFLTEFFDWGLVQTDPHFGNYRIRVGEKPAEDRIVLLDFGATRRFAPGFVRNYGQIVGGAVMHDAARVRDGAIAIGLMKPATPASAMDAFVKMCELIVEPFGLPDEVMPGYLNDRGAYRFGDNDLPMRAANSGARSALSVHFQLPPREIVFLHRRISGVFVMLASLQAELKTRDLLLKRLADAGVA